MPESLHPPYTAAAKTIPRQLNRWLDINSQNGPLKRTSTYITLPVFSETVSWLGYSDIVAAFNFEGPNNFSLKAISDLPTDPNYLLCIMWKDSSNVTHRYAMWQDVGEVIYFDLPLYTGQLIKKNFRFEVWSTNSTPAVQTTELIFYTTVLTGIDYRYGADSKLVENDTETIDFDNTNTTFALPVTNLVVNFDSTQYLVTYIASP